MLTMIALKVLGISAGVYVLTVLALLVIIRLKKDERGDPILDSNSWHFKMAYPFRRFNENYIHYVKETGINMCSYFASMVFMLYIGWLWIMLCKAVIFIMSVIFYAPFGFWMSLNLNEWADRKTMHVFDLNLPKIKSFKIRPIYFILLAVYVWLWLKYPVGTGQVTVTIVIGIFCAAIFWGIIFLLTRLEKNSRTFSLSAAWIADKKKGLCRNLKVM